MMWGITNGFCGGGFGLFGGFFNLAFWALIIWLVLTLVSRSKKERIEKNEENPVGILKKRYARGEISKKEYEDMKEELK